MPWFPAFQQFLVVFYPFHVFFSSYLWSAFFPKTLHLLFHSTHWTCSIKNERPVNERPVFPCISCILGIVMDDLLVCLLHDSFSRIWFAAGIYVAVLICLLLPRNMSWSYVDKSMEVSSPRKNQPFFRVLRHFLRGRLNLCAVPRNCPRKNRKTGHFLRGGEDPARYST